MWKVLVFFLLMPLFASAQINTERVMLMGRNALYYEDYVLAIQRFNMVIDAKPYLAEPYFYRGLAKFYLEDYWGAEEDCTQAIERNPFLPDNYRLRGLCRINLKDFEGAIADYTELLAIEPEEQNALHNMALCYIELKDYEKATATVDNLIRISPKVGRNYIIKAQACFLMTDTVQAVECLDKALEINPYDGDAWQFKAMVYADKEEYEKAERAMDNTILQYPKESSHYVNRALIRYHRQNLRGAMDDYDIAIELEPKSYVGHFNRGLLRAQVGDDNRAIEDFNYVLSIEPDNMIALFNRALMLDNTGDFQGAIKDITKVLEAYPNFLEGYQYRAQIYRKTGDTRSAERDEFKVLKAQMEKKPIAQGNTRKTRKQSDRAMEDYDKLLESDDEETLAQYESEYRGRVQDRKAETRPEPVYVMTFYPKEKNFQRFIYNKNLEKLNASGLLPDKIQLANYEKPLDKDELERHKKQIGKWTDKLTEYSEDAFAYLARGLEYYTIQDYEHAQDDAIHALTIDSSFVLARFLKNQIQLKEIEAKTALIDGQPVPDNLSLDLLFHEAMADCERILAVEPDFTYCRYNLGNLYLMMKDYRAAISAYDEVIRQDSQMGCAYYNRGIAYLMTGDHEAGIRDLSSAGELGLYSAYNLIKRYSKNDGKNAKENK